MTNDPPPDGAPPPASADHPTATRREPRRSKRIVLQADVDADGRRNLSVEREGDDLVIRGHDLGPVVTRAWGAGTSEYEWAWRIPAASFPAMLAALGGHAGDDLIDLVRRWSEANPGRDPGVFLKRAEVALEFWSRVGD
jgi:hypothetical protein